MQQLSGLDASFLYLETPEMPMHVGALQVFERPAGQRGRFAGVLRRHVAARLAAAPVLRRRLWWMPLNLANPAWVDADPDLRWHIVEHKLPKGAGLPEMQARVAELHMVLLDRARPLWRMHVFEGLAPGPGGQARVGLYTQLHHAAVDGQAAVALGAVLLDTSETPRPPAARMARRGQVFQLGVSEMLRGALAHQASKVAQIVRELPSTVGTLKDAALLAASRSALFGGDRRPSNLALAPRLAFNATVGRTRAFGTATLPLDEVRRVGKALGATVNDMVLMLCSGALRRYHARRHVLPRKSMIAAVPISLRETGDERPDNQASMSLVSLGTHIADTRKRVAHVLAATAAMKQAMGSVESLLPTDFPSLGVPWLMEAATAIYGKARVADRIPQVANLVISNVPGPPVPLYLAGARLLSNHPASIVVHGLGLNVTVQSQAGALDFGLMADGATLPDVQLLADDLAAALDDLREIMPPELAEAPSLIGLARRGLGQAVGAATGIATRTAREVVDSAVRTAVKTAVRGTAATLGAATGRASAGARAGGKGRRRSR
jgi:diacylglycerol O-acyltransferase / wax synthase